MSCLIYLRISILLNLCTWTLVFSADTQYMKTSIQNYLSDTRHHFQQFSPYKQKAKEFIYGEFTRFGLSTEYCSFNAPITDNRINSSYTFNTVVGILKGDRFGTVNDAIVGLGAHYDTVSTTKGVDDNGAGVVALLEVAKQITNLNKKGTKRNNTIMFASFDLEEYDYYGSKYFVKTWMPQWLNTNYGNAIPAMTHGVIILDTMMDYNTSGNSQTIPQGTQTMFNETYTRIKSDNFRGDFLSLIYRKPTTDSDLAQAFKSAWEDAGRTQYELESFPLPFDNISIEHRITTFGDFLRSDHRNFWLTGIPAIWLTDSANFRGDMIQCYHNPCDNLEVMLTDENINFLGKTADAIATTMGRLSEPTGGTISGGTIKSKYTDCLLVVFFLVYFVI